jgi:hypothetical protein
MRAPSLVAPSTASWRSAFATPWIGPTRRNARALHWPLQTAFVHGEYGHPQPRGSGTVPGASDAATPLSHAASGITRPRLRSPAAGFTSSRASSIRARS